MAVVTMRQLLESGVHFGHQTRRWNPKMKRFIFTERNGIYIIDLQKSLSDIDRAYEFVKETVAHGGSILFVGTKKQAQEAVAEQATRVGMPFVNQRWLGGMLTNFGTVHKRLQRLKELEEIDFDDVASSNLTKKELLVLRREKDKLERTLGGIRDMAKVPSAVWVVDTKKEHLAVAEARKLRIPVVAILDTNCDPDEVDYGIPGNDDAIRSVALLTRVVADAVAEGLVARSGAKVEGAEAIVIGRSNLMGKPMAQLLLAANATVTMAHSRTRDLASVVRRADIVVAAVGQPEMVRGDWIKEGAIVIDVGINRVPTADGKYRLTGDVAYAEALERAAAITPVPGGVGQMSVPLLMANTAEAARRASA